MDRVEGGGWHKGLADAMRDVAVGANVFKADLVALYTGGDVGVGVVTRVEEAEGTPFVYVESGLGVNEGGEVVGGEAEAV